MKLGPWIALATVLAVPLLVASHSGRNWLTHRARSERIWVPIVTAAVLGALFAFGVSRHSVGVGAAVLVATPLMQAIVFVAADRAFQLLAGRVPVSFDQAPHGRREDGRRHWPDAIFWVTVWMALIAGGVFLCAHLDIEFPSGT